MIRPGTEKEQRMEQLTIKEIAKLCGVGVSTVSRAINNHPDINEETKTKVLETIREYNYYPNNSARNLKRAASSTIAVLIKGIGNPFFGAMIEVLEREIIRKRYSFVLQQVEEDEDEIEAAIRLEKEKRLKGIIFLGGLSRHNPELFKLMKVPYVIATVDPKFPEHLEGGAVVSIRDEEESCRIVDYLIGKGHKKIAVLAATKEDTSIGRIRLDGYKKALKDHSLPFDEKLVCYTPKEKEVYTISNGYEMASRLLAGKEQFTCIYAISDTLAIGACKAIFDAGKKIPEDISVAGFDGLEIAHYYQPSVTTVCQPREEMASSCVKILFDLIKKKPVTERTYFPAELQEGQSVRTIE